jgi:hypothetical protein
MWGAGPGMGMGIVERIAPVGDRRPYVNRIFEVTARQRFTFHRRGRRFGGGIVET